jgi:hypothetical protein
MGRAKEIIVKVIPSKLANEFIKQHHYSGKVVNNSILHFGCFLDEKLHGVLSYGSPLDKRKVLPLVQPSLWNEMLELNRMAFDEYLPKYSESRCIAISIRLIRKNAPHIKWILSFSDGTQCGDGTIYRASGFYLTSIKKNDQVWEIEGMKVTDTSIRPNIGSLKTFNKVVSRISATKGVNILNNGASSMSKFKELGYKPLQGFQLRYIYLIDKSCIITVPILPFSMIDKMGAGMYKGEKITLAERQQAQEVNQDKRDASSIEIGGSNPTLALNLQAKNRQHG